MDQKQTMSYINSSHKEIARLTRLLEGHPEEWRIHKEGIYKNDMVAYERDKKDNLDFLTETIEYYEKELSIYQPKLKEYLESISATEQRMLFKPKDLKMILESKPKPPSRKPISYLARAYVEKRAHNKCEFEGCEHIENLHIHHRLPVANGGTNDLDNLLLVCPNHHAMMHTQLRRTA